jgi:predicted phage terminase large subunit-like protein
MKNRKLKNKEDAIQLMNDPTYRREICKRSFLTFFQVYFSEYIKYPLDTMHRKIIKICQSETIELGLIMAFRGSGKSTIVSTAYPLWAILGVQQKHFVVIVCRTKMQAKQMMRNIRDEAEHNVYLKNDLGPFREETDEWGSESLVFSNRKAKIMVVSMEQSFKGVRYREHRPDLIILDDIEDNESVKTSEGRDKTKEKYTRDIVPLGDKHTKILHVGNMLSAHSLMMEIGSSISGSSPTEVFRRFPIVDETNKPLWVGKYPTYTDVLIEKAKVRDEVAWALEYELRILPGVHQIINPTFIQYYDHLPEKRRNSSGMFPERYIVVGIDLAISQKDSADYTAITPILFEQQYDDTWKGYVLENFVRRRMDMNMTADEIISLYKSLHVYNCPVTVVVEGVGFQKAIVDIIKLKFTYPISIQMVPITQSKETRLRIVQPLFANNHIYFPRAGSEYIVQELLGFGQEKHDDVVDSITIALNYALDEIYNQQEVFIV